jgi:cytochrome c oxidase subunit II
VTARLMAFLARGDPSWVAVVAFELAVLLTVGSAIAFHHGTTERDAFGSTRIGWRGLGALVGTVGAIAVGCWMFWVDYRAFLDRAVAPADAYEIQATGQLGTWSFTYPTGKVSQNCLVVPRGRFIRLVLSAKHAVAKLSLPQYGLTRDAIPGRYTSLWFQATEAADPRQFEPVSLVSVLEPANFDQWLLEKEPSRAKKR